MSILAGIFRNQASLSDFYLHVRGKRLSQSYHDYEKHVQKLRLSSELCVTSLTACV